MQLANMCPADGEKGENAIGQIAMQSSNENG